MEPHKKPGGMIQKSGKKLSRLLYSKTGPLTEQLRLAKAQERGLLLPAAEQNQTMEQTTCGFCSTGCSLSVRMGPDGPTGVVPDEAAHVNRGTACPKGWEALKPLTSKNRATQPLLRRPNGAMTPATWNEATDKFCSRFKSIKDQFGPSALAFLSTGQITTEEMAYLGTLAKFGLEFRHGDGNTRQCMATSAVAYKQSFGFDAPPYTYADFEHSDVIFLVGSNLCLTHPIMWSRIKNSTRSPIIITIDPRSTETTQASHIHIPITPKADLHFFYELSRMIIERDGVAEGFINRHTNNFAAYKEFLLNLDRDDNLRRTGQTEELINEITALILSGKRCSFWWTMGVNQSHQGVLTAQAIINLALMTGNIGKPGTGANSITGQCNAMGSRLFSNTTTLLGGRNFANPIHRQEVAEILGISNRMIPDHPGFAYDQILEQIEKGTIKGLWVIATNTAHSWLSRKRVQKLLKKLEFLVVQDMYHSTETSQLADLILPAAGWGEKSGTFINSERRINVVKKLQPAPGQALSDLEIFQRIAQVWGVGEFLRSWASPEDIFEALKKLSKKTPCDFSQIRDYHHIEEAGGIQWPHAANLKARDHERRLFEDQKFFHKDGKAKFIFALPKESKSTPDQEFPLWLITGRGSSAQWHTETRTAESPILTKMCQRQPFAEVNPRDGQKYRIEDRAITEITTKTGTITALLVYNCAMPEGCIFLSMHHPETNNLTFWELDEQSRQPAFKSTTASLGRKVPP